MRIIDIHGMTNMELVRGETNEWYWATDYIHGDLYEAEELFRQGHLVKSNRLGTHHEDVASKEDALLLLRYVEDCLLWCFRKGINC